MPKAYSYIRFSSAEQSKGRSQPRQMEACVKYCLANDLDLATGEDYTFLDRGKSAYTAEHLGENGQLARFLRLVKNGTISAGSFLIVESLDRLSREHVKQALPRFMDLLNAGINIVTLTDNKVYSSDFTSIDLILSIFVMSRAHEESSTKAKRLGDAWKKKQQAAREENKPLGAAAPLWLDYTPEGYQLNETRAAIIRRVFQLSIDGYGKSVIAKALNNEGTPSFKGKTWGTSSIQKILTNKAVLGEYQPHTGSGNKRQPIGEPIEGYYPPVIDESIFYQAQDATSGRRTARTTKQSKRFNIWQGLARCTLCLTAMHLVNKGTPPKGGTYLHCFHARKGLCTAKAIRLDQSEIIFKEVLAKVDSLSLVQDSSAAISKQLSEIEARLSEQNVNLSGLRELLRGNKSPTIRDLVLDCEQEISNLKEQKETLHAALAADTITDKSTFFARLDLDSYEGRSRANSLLKRLKVGITISKDSNRTTYIVSQAGKILIGIIHFSDGRVDSVAFTANQVEKVKAQDFDGSIGSSIDRLISERMSDRIINKTWWDDATLDTKITEMLTRVGASLNRDTPQFQELRDMLDLDRIFATPQIQAWASNALLMLKEHE